MLYLRSSVQRVMQEGLRAAGVRSPNVLGTSRSHAEAQGSDTWAAYADRSGQLAVARMRFGPQGPLGVQPFTLHDTALKELALRLALQEGVELASNIGAAGLLEVYARLASRSAESVREITDPADSPVGLDVATERQFCVDSVLGDNAVLLTVNKATGALRLETFN